MTPSARIQAAIDLLDLIIASARDGGPAADTLIARYFKERRYAGSRDRRAVRDHVYDAIRRAGERPDDGRAAVVGLALERPEIAVLFDGSAHGPAPIEPGEGGAEAGDVPVWLQPLFAAPVEQDALLGRAPVDLRVNRLKATAARACPMRCACRRAIPSSRAQRGKMAWSRFRTPAASGSRRPVARDPA